MKVVGGDSENLIKFVVEVGGDESVGDGCNVVVVVLVVVVVAWWCHKKWWIDVSQSPIERDSVAIRVDRVPIPA